MQIKVNGKAVEVFSGARVADVLRKYSRAAWKQVQKNRKTVFNAAGHEVALNGELSGGEELFVKSVEEAKPEP